MSMPFDVHSTLCKQLQRILQHLAYAIEQTRVDVPSVQDQEQVLYLLKIVQRYPELWPDVRTLILEAAEKMEQAGHREEWQQVLVYWRDFSQQKEEHESTAALALQIGRVQQLNGEFECAKESFGQSVKLSKRASNTHREAMALIRLAYVSRLMGDLAQAEQLAKEALQLLPPDNTDAARAYAVLATVADDGKEHNQAVELHEKALMLWRQSDNGRMLAWCLRDLGGVLYKVERYEDAEASLNEALTVFERFEDPVHQASAYMNLATVYLETERPEEAVKIYLEVESIFRNLGDARRLAIVYTNLGCAYQQLDNFSQAKFVLENAVARWRSLGDSKQEANAQEELQNVYHAIREK